MMKLIIIGERDSKRADYMKQAAGDLGVTTELFEWDALQDEETLCHLTGAAVKIEPPGFRTENLARMRKFLTEEYKRALEKLAGLDCRFLNPPETIWQLLDKKKTKQLLKEQQIPATQMVSERFQNASELLCWMRKNRRYGVFIKPRFFSGAAGVAALRINPRGEMALYTSCRRTEKSLANTKRLVRMTGQGDILKTLDALFSLDCIVELWHPKSMIGKKSYDLRIVYQFGHIAHIVARQSGGPITNLHLNNGALPVEALGLSDNDMRRITDVCRGAMSCFPGLTMAGIDILLEKDTMRPLIIEMNGQGDLIYQDIYGENNIYREQVRELCSMSI